LKEPSTKNKYSGNCLDELERLNKMKMEREKRDHIDKEYAQLQKKMKACGNIEMIMDN
jgi:hypothetical protein